MTRLKALKDMYIDGRMVLRGNLYTVDDNVARQHLRDGKAEAAPSKTKPAGENRHTKITGGREKK